MCDYMYYEHKQRAKIKNPLPETESEPELERILVEEEQQEEQPVILKA